jgi:hypothetical protein
LLIFFSDGTEKWTTDKQEAWLSEWIPDFVQAQKDKSSLRFFTPIYSEFHRLWPYREPTKEEIEAQMKNNNAEEEDVERANNDTMAKSSSMMRTKYVSYFYQV